MFNLALISIECSSLLSPHSSTQAHCNGGGYDQLNFSCTAGVDLCVCVKELSVSISC